MVLAYFGLLACCDDHIVQYMLPPLLLLLLKMVGKYKIYIFHVSAVDAVRLFCVMLQV